MARRSKFDFSEDRIRWMAAKGLSAVSIASWIGCHRTTLAYHIERNAGLRAAFNAGRIAFCGRPGRLYRRGRFVSPRELEEWTAAGMKQREIADKLGFSLKRLLDYLRVQPELRAAHQRGLARAGRSWASRVDVAPKVSAAHSRRALRKRLDGLAGVHGKAMDALLNACDDGDGKRATKMGGIIEEIAAAEREARLELLLDCDPPGTA